MRREGYEFAVSKAEVLYKTDEHGKKLEPMELAYVDVPEEFAGTVIEKLSLTKRRAAGHEHRPAAATPDWSSPSRPAV